MLNDGTDSQIFTVNRDIEPKQSSCLVLFTYYGEYTDKDLARALFTKQKNPCELCISQLVFKV